MNRIEELRQIIEKLQPDKVQIVNTERSTIAFYPAKTSCDVVAIVITSKEVKQ